MKQRRAENIMAEKNLLLEVRRKKEIHSQWKQGHGAWKTTQIHVWICRDGIRKAEALI